MLIGFFPDGAVLCSQHFTVYFLGTTFRHGHHMELGGMYITSGLKRARGTINVEQVI